MNKQELAEELSNKVAGVSRAQAERLLDVMTRTITEKLRADEIVSLAGFGAFSAKKRKGRTGVNPRNVNEPIEIPAVTVAKFKPGKNLKDSLKRKDRPLFIEEEPEEEVPAEGPEPVEGAEEQEPVEPAEEPTPSETEEEPKEEPQN